MAQPSTTAYCTILAKNYLPKALALADSLQRHHPDSRFTLLLIDGVPDGLPSLSGVDYLDPSAIGLSVRETHQLAAIYNLVEFATAVKPLLLRTLLQDSEQVAYLDPDTYVTSPMRELAPSIAATEGGILLTPHFLEPVPADSLLSEGHLLAVGVYNLGFCAVDRRAGDFLDWWWSHLETECLGDPTAALFVDQKWVDIGSVLFRAGALRHYGYNTGVANLHERPIGVDADGYHVTTNGDRLRLFHFHAFDPDRPGRLSVRFEVGDSSTDPAMVAIYALCQEYAVLLKRFAADLPEAPPYPYDRDSSGRPISRHLRRAYRLAAASGAELPSPFLPTDAAAFAAWRKRARVLEARWLTADVVKSVRLTFPEEYRRLKTRFPAAVRRLRGLAGGRSGIWH